MGAPFVGELASRVSESLTTNRPIVIAKRRPTLHEIQATALARKPGAKNGAFTFEKFHNGGSKGPKEKLR